MLYVTINTLRSGHHLSRNRFAGNFLWRPIVWSLSNVYLASDRWWWKRGRNMAVDATWSASTGDADDELAIRCREGNQRAFNELVTRYQSRIFLFTYRLLLDRSEAEDAVQETFLRAFKALPKYRPDGYFSSWIYRIALNECRRRIRSRKVTVSLEIVDSVSSSPDPQNAMMTGERNRVVRMAVDALPEHYRVVMMLFYFEEMSVDQISRTINVSVSAVKVRLYRGRERLSRRLSATM